ncbi:lasso peptide biosynthesis B2 protein [Nocardioides sp. YIM 152588]|uniref:lasso peptide biosynthesis B2 protein n=1 Tax=Nocardioides sp. YIM 152588 TaxID=3158259 RepID=UPI0032E49A80
MAVVVVAAVVEVGLRVTTLPRLARLLGVSLKLGDRVAAPGRPTIGALPPRAAMQVRMTQRVLRRSPFGSTCLRQALVSGQRIRRLGPVLHIGVAKIGGEVRAHAWLVVGGRVIDPDFGAVPYRALIPVREVVGDD